MSESADSAPFPTAPETCGKPAASLIPRLGQSFACVLTAGHNGECAPGGTCFEHGPYIGRPGTTPSCPKCTPTAPATTAGAPDNLADEIGYQTALNMLDEIDGYPTACVLVRRYIDELRGRLATLQHQLACCAAKASEDANVISGLRTMLSDADARLDTPLSHQHAEQDAEVNRLRGIIERERTAADTWIRRTLAAVRSHRGISQSRGSYEWDDETYFKEFGAALDDIERALNRAERDTNARSLADCPTAQVEVDAARATLTHAEQDARVAAEEWYCAHCEEWRAVERMVLLGSDSVHIVCTTCRFEVAQFMPATHSTRPDKETPAAGA